MGAQNSSIAQDEKIPEDTKHKDRVIIFDTTQTSQNVPFQDQLDQNYSKELLQRTVLSSVLQLFAKTELLITNKTITLMEKEKGELLEKIKRMKLDIQKEKISLDQTSSVEAIKDLLLHEPAFSKAAANSPPFHAESAWINPEEITKLLDIALSGGVLTAGEVACCKLEAKFRFSNAFCHLDEPWTQWEELLHDSAFMIFIIVDFGSWTEPGRHTQSRGSNQLEETLYYISQFMSLWKPIEYNVPRMAVIMKNLSEFNKKIPSSRSEFTKVFSDYSRTEYDHLNVLEFFKEKLEHEAKSGYSTTTRFHGKLLWRWFEDLEEPSTTLREAILFARNADTSNDFSAT
jgi:hypothetical protein